MTDEPTLESVFRKRSEQTADDLPVFSALCAAVADDPALAAPLDGLKVGWPFPDRLLTAASLLLREEARGHRLAEYFRTFGGTREADDGLVPAFADLVDTHRERFTELARTKEARWNDPARVAQFWPALTLAASREEQPFALIELGGAAGLTAQPDRYGYRFGDQVVGADRPLVLDLELRGETPGHLGTPVAVSTRTVIDRDPFYTDDPATVDLLRASVRPDLADQLHRVDLALAEAEDVTLSWRVGDLVDILPAAIAETPEGLLPVVYGSAVLCCLNERRPRFAEILAEAGRDLVWLSIEAPANSLALLSDDPVTEVKDKVHLTAVTYRAGKPVAAEVLAEVDPWARWLDWNPRTVEITA